MQTELTYKEKIELAYLQLEGFIYLVRNEIGSAEVFVKEPKRKKTPGSGYSIWVERDYPITNEEMRRRKNTKLGKYAFLTWDSEPVLISDLIGAKEENTVQ